MDDATGGRRARPLVGEPQTAKGSSWEDAMALRDGVRAERLALLDEPDLA